jgi:hypothetical protein
MMNLAFEASLFTLRSDFFLHAVKSYDVGIQLYISPKEGMLWIFITLKNAFPWPNLNL